MVVSKTVEVSHSRNQCRNRKRANPSKSKAKHAKSPRISFYVDKTGRRVKIYRCQTCASFVGKKNPQCHTCLGIPHIGKKKAASMQKAANAKKPTMIKTNIRTENKSNNKPIHTTTKVLQVNQRRRRRKYLAKVPCIYCFRLTRSKDAVCLTCKNENRQSNSIPTTPVDQTNEDQVTGSDGDKKKKTLIKVQSIQIRPPKHQQASMTTREDMRLLKQASEKKLSCIVSDLENLLCSTAVQETHETEENFYVSIKDINKILKDKK